MPETKVKLNPNAQKWVKALRSGKYKQTRGTLRRGDRFCCLGVACDLYAKANPGLKWKAHTGRIYSFAGCDGVLPPEVFGWLGGLDNTRGSYRTTSLAKRNDDGATFEQIADAIERNAEELGVSA